MSPQDAEGNHDRLKPEFEVELGQAAFYRALTSPYQFPV